MANRYYYLETMSNINISDWEIARILQKSSVSLLGEYESMKERIRGWPWVHYDETVWNVQSWDEKRYARTMVGTEGVERVYVLGTSRWWWNAESLKWESTAIWISDNYWAYKNLFDNHQLCWAHPIRKMRDLVNSKNLTKLQREQCSVSYDGLRRVHNTLLEMLKTKERTKANKIDLNAY